MKSLTISKEPAICINKLYKFVKAFMLQRRSIFISRLQAFQKALISCINDIGWEDYIIRLHRKVHLQQLFEITLSLETFVKFDVPILCKESKHNSANQVRLITRKCQVLLSIQCSEEASEEELEGERIVKVSSDFVW
jgi:hypothetical protein